jgi:hypothetical protein
MNTPDWKHKYRVFSQHESRRDITRDWEESWGRKYRHVGRGRVDRSHPSMQEQKYRR